ncbi:MAG: CRISPR-associated helicase Cas3' [Candidatus Thiodiazotropha sp. (ex Dulcina madagascariensis)]|nr:CRISPR-associated helicase Cas3' [Candidatus Thiodiazotropha sp. (ex Dulcina madagascariensis)]
MVVSNISSFYYRYWGKTAEDGRYHLLPYHCLDVAAVGEIFLCRNTHVRQRLAEMLSLDETKFISLAKFFLGLHDIGKFARHFQALQPDLYHKLQGGAAELNYVRHDALGAVLWKSCIRPHCSEHGYFGVLPRQGRRPSSDSSVDYWMHTVIGHHGKPVTHREPEIRAPSWMDYFPESNQQAARSFFDDWYILSGVSAIDLLPSIAKVKSASWWLAGLAVACDWLGSNQDFFELRSASMPLDQYWQLALTQAEKAIEAAGILPSKSASLCGFSELFGKDFKIPTPLQAQCRELPLNKGPGIYLLEDMTGAGKTEAALILAHRLLAETGESGLYFALPTMATANSMFDRMGSVYRRLYTDEATPSLVLAHGARRLHKGFRDAINIPFSATHTDYGDDMQPAEVHCAAWLSDNPKKSLLAEVGVGTVDQAVLGILPSRHQSLRLFGLLGKVLIIDEVHAYEEYLFRLLKALITFHTVSGGSVILLSATLPHRQRSQLLEAFYEGIGQEPRRLERRDDHDYPLLTRASTEEQNEIVLALRDEVCREVAVKRIDTLEQVEALMLEAVRHGRCLCWIRNTVHDAREAYRELKSRHPDWSIDLFHARYALADRLAIEDRVVHRFGKKGGGEQRTRQILIATPVVEQSLDIDFDEMISDLAPIDLIIQRGGRLHRHCRDYKGNLVEALGQRGTTTLRLFAPEAVDEPDKEWFAGFLPKAAFVYDNHAQLWLGLRLLMKKGSFSMPDDARHLIEGVYGIVEPPPGLAESYFESQGEQSSEGSLGDYNALQFTAYYGDTGSGRWWSEEKAPTRLGDSTTVYLVRWDGNLIEPLRSQEDFPWHASSVSVLTSRIKSTERPVNVPESEWERALAELPAKGRWGVLLVLDDDLNGVAVDFKGEATPVRYCNVKGLLVGDECGDL